MCQSILLLRPWCLLSKHVYKSIFFPVNCLSLRIANMSSQKWMWNWLDVGRYLNIGAWGKPLEMGEKILITTQCRSLETLSFFHFPCVCCLTVWWIWKEWLMLKIGSELTFSHFYQQLPKVSWHNSWWIQAQWISFAIFNFEASKPPQW